MQSQQRTKPVFFFQEYLPLGDTLASGLLGRSLSMRNAAQSVGNRFLAKPPIDCPSPGWASISPGSTFLY